ncbi:MAG: phenylalanine--tRNA ligase subunit beta [Armatimonadetes bacterium]|nr:phenylalanine--tRNA ligase subunit beta [Armatimonadota bacterium]
MKFPVSMLTDFVTTKLSADELGDLLTMAGFELEGIEEVNGEAVLDIKVVSNRGDGLSVRGLAREVLAKDRASAPTAHYDAANQGFRAELSGIPLDTPGTRIRIDSKACDRFSCLIIEGFDPSIQAPEWMTSRLIKAGMRSISLLVDLTNYVMLELGQPLHAYDLDKLEGERIIVREAVAGEKITTLNGDEHELQPGQLMICDASRPVGVAGVMGGLDTEVSETTTRCLLEGAHFDGLSVRKTRKQLGLNTDASYRFERSVDPELVMTAMGRFAQLMREIAPNAQLVSIEEVVESVEPKRTVSLSFAKATAWLGMEITPENGADYLRRLGFGVEGHEPVQVTVPMWRPDIVREIDLVEELGRVHGYENIPAWLPAGSTPQGGVWEELHEEDRIIHRLAALGLTQCMSHSLRPASPLAAGDESQRVGPRNPGSPELAYLRDSVLPCLAEVAQRADSKDLGLFELGRVFATGSGGRREWKQLGILLSGLIQPLNRQKDTPPEADFFALKTIVADLADHLGVEFTYVQGADGRLHKGRQARLMVGGTAVGVMGQIHPELAEELRLPANTQLAEVDLELLLAQPSSRSLSRSVSRNPAVRRDLAILIDQSVPYATLESTLREAVGETLESIWLFDVFQGANIPEGKHSLGVALQLRKLGGNFTDEEANQVRDRAVAAIATLGATIR